MYVGHFATGLLLKSLVPDVPSAPIIYGVGLLDIIDGIFTIVGINRVRPNLSAGPYLFFDLVFIDWDHSLLMALILSAAWGLYWHSSSRSGRTALVAFAASFSHWLCDLPFHNLDLAAYPYSEEHFGWGWWGRFLTGAWVMEGAFSLLCLGLTAVLAGNRLNLKGPALTCLALFVNLSPWLTPMYYVAQLDPPYEYLVHGAFVTLGFVGPAWLMVRMLDGQDGALASKRKVL